METETTESTPSRYLTAEVCLNGHTTTDALERFPELEEKFCSSCGLQTIRQCVDCKSPIRGAYYVQHAVLPVNYEPPKRCHNCGSAFPWTKARLAAAKEHALVLPVLDDAEKAALQQAIDDIASGGPQMDLAIPNFNRLMKKASQAMGSGIYKIVFDISCDAAKKTFLSV